MHFDSCLVKQQHLKACHLQNYLSTCPVMSKQTVQENTDVSPAEDWQYQEASKVWAAAFVVLPSSTAAAKMPCHVNANSSGTHLVSVQHKTGNIKWQAKCGQQAFVMLPSPHPMLLEQLPECIVNARISAESGLV